ncbi:cytochrome P450 2D17-like isoform X2 [Choloepus didactylus]|uniref:cytochrome P450 2D17-like isoform X2 n=1 Tax=Choloepus didactylus TaxID=27675 RepID=UPI0018A0E262|nr:cytochrome P450 2D17-like isoform X2 [Choloepus didactylus]
MGLLTGEALAPLAVAVAVFVLLLDLMHRRVLWAPRYPPGPLPLPGLGNFLQVDPKDMPNSFNKLRRRFGDVFGVQLGWKPVVVVNGLAAVREAALQRGEDTSDRPPVPLREQLGSGPHAQGVIAARYGPAWREQRRFSVSTMRDFGLGKKSLEQWVTEEAACLCAAFTDYDGECRTEGAGTRGATLPDPHPPSPGRPFSPNRHLNQAVCNVIASLTHGRRFEYSDPSFRKLLGLLEGSEKDSAFLREAVNAFPVLLRIPGMAGKAFPRQTGLIHLLDELLTEHRQDWDPAQPPRDLTDVFMGEVEKAKGNPESSFNDANLRVVVADLFIAGMVTTSITLTWALLLMILHPDVQGRVQNEIDEVIGRGRRPEMVDQGRMPFTTAVIHEVQRFGDIIPLGIPHMTSRDTEIQGFLIPKGTQLILNLSSVLKDETVWEKPFRFHPEHFLDAQGHFVKPEAFMPFSAGRRACLGEPLARMELFLFFTCLLQRFSFSVPAGQPQPSDHGLASTLVSPSPYQLCALPR